MVAKIFGQCKSAAHHIDQPSGVKRRARCWNTFFRLVATHGFVDYLQQDIETFAKFWIFLDMLTKRSLAGGGRLSSVNRSGPTIPRPGFKSQAQHLRFAFLKLNLNCNVYRIKEAENGHIKKYTRIHGNLILIKI